MPIVCPRLRSKGTLGLDYDDSVSFDTGYVSTATFLVHGDRGRGRTFGTIDVVVNYAGTMPFRPIAGGDLGWRRRCSRGWDGACGGR